jgi:hypothetical protein
VLVPTSAQDGEKQPFGRGPVVRPPAKPFNAEEARQLTLLVTRVPGPDGQSYLQLASHRFINGYTERNVAVKVRGRGVGEGREARRKEEEGCGG